MGHIVFPAPDLERFHLLERLARELRSRGHRVTVLCLDRVDFTFWSAQGMDCIRIHPGAPMPSRVPLDELAEDDCKRRGQLAHGPARERVQRRLAALLPGVVRWLESELPDLVCLHQSRTSAHRMVHFIARELGIRVLWTGSGLLPHTVQIDEEGIDGNARACRRSAWDYRAIDANEPFLDSALAAVLGRNLPPALSRRTLQVPSLPDRLRDAAAALVARDPRGAFAAIDSWRRALPELPLPPRRSELPAVPFVAVLLQRDDDPRLLLDCHAPPNPHMLVSAARAAARKFDKDMPVVAVLPRGGLLTRELAPLRRLAGVRLEAADAAVDAAAAALAVVTINDGNAVAALLAGTPVVHLGVTPYGVPGVAVRGRTDALGQALERAVAEDQPELRRRCLTWLLAHGHVWCSPEQPDHNGIAGLVLAIERRMTGAPGAGGRIQYRAGPAWPLAAEGRA